MHRDRHVLEREESVRGSAHAQGAGYSLRHARHRLERGQRGQREHGHHHLGQVVRVDRRNTERQHPRHRGGKAHLHDERCGSRQPGVVALERVGPSAHGRDGAQRRIVGAEGQQLGYAVQRVDHLGRERARQRGDLVVATTPPGQQRGDRQRKGQREPEREGGPRKDDADGHCADDAGAGRDRHGQQAAKIEVLEGVDVVDRPGQQVATAPAGEGRGDTRGEAVIEPHSPPGQGPQGGVVAHETLLVAQRPAQEGQHLDRGQDPDERVEPGPKCGPAHHVPRPRQQADGGGGGRQPEQSGEGEPPPGGARFGQDAAQRAAPGAHDDTARGSGAPAGSETTRS